MLDLGNLSGVRIDLGAEIVGLLKRLLEVLALDRLLYRDLPRREIGLLGRQLLERARVRRSFDLGLDLRPRLFVVGLGLLDLGNLSGVRIDLGAEIGRARQRSHEIPTLRGRLHRRLAGGECRLLRRHFGEAGLGRLHQPRLQRGQRRLVLLLGGLLLLEILVDRLQLRQELVEHRDGLRIGSVVDKSSDRIDEGAHGRLLWMLPPLELLDLRDRRVVRGHTRLPLRRRLLGLAPKGRHLLAEGPGIGKQAVDRRLRLGGVGGVDLAEGCLVARNQRRAARGERVVARPFAIGRGELQVLGHCVHRLLERRLQGLRLRIRPDLSGVTHAPLLLQTAAHREARIPMRRFMPVPCAGRSVPS